MYNPNLIASSYILYALLIDRVSYVSCVPFGLMTVSVNFIVLLTFDVCLSLCGHCTHIQWGCQVPVSDTRAFHWLTAAAGVARIGPLALHW